MDFNCLVFVLAFLAETLAIKRYYGTESCGHVHGPDHLTVIEFDKDVDYVKNKPSTEQNLAPPFELRNTVWDCVIVVQGMPSTSVRKSIGVEWRSFHIRDSDVHTVEQSKEACGKAYVAMYKGSDTNSRELVTMCGKDTTRTFFEYEGDYVTFRFYADFRRNESWTSPEPPTTTPTTVDPNCILSEDIGNNMTTNLPLCRTKPTTTPYDPYPYPEIYFRVDITSFDYSCNESIPDEVLKCNDSQRCLNEDLMCDYYFSHNCKSPGFPNDKTDQTRDAPSYCFRKETTTPIPTTTTEAPATPVDWRPIVGVIGAILAMFILCWCCWRPGYLPWRLSRLRNVPFFNTTRCVCCRRKGPTILPCLKCCAGDGNANYTEPLGSGGMYNTAAFVSRLRARRAAGKVGTAPYGSLVNPAMVKGGKYSPGGSLGNNGYLANTGQPGNAPSRGDPFTYGQDPDNFATDWLKLISGDGAHLREQR